MAAYQNVLDLCEGSPDWEEATQPPANPAFELDFGDVCQGSASGLLATFTIEIAVGTTHQSAPDAGSAVVTMAGGAGQDSIFDGDGAVGGVLADSDGTFVFPRLGHTLLPGNAGGASVTCNELLVPCDGSGWARLLLDGTRYEVHGDAVGIC